MRLAVIQVLHTVLLETLAGTLNGHTQNGRREGLFQLGDKDEKRDGTTEEEEEEEEEEGAA